MGTLQTTLYIFLSSLISLVLFKPANSLNEKIINPINLCGKPTLESIQGGHEILSVDSANFASPKPAAPQIDKALRSLQNPVNKVDSHSPQQAFASRHDSRNNLPSASAMSKGDSNGKSEIKLDDSTRIAATKTYASKKARFPRSISATFNMNSKKGYNPLVSSRPQLDDIMGYDEVFAVIDLNKVPNVLPAGNSRKLQTLQSDRQDLLEIDRGHLVKKWSQKTVSNCERQGLDLELMDIMNTCLNVKNKNPHIEIPAPISADHYHQLKRLWEYSSDFKNQIARVEATIKEKLGNFELFRRINAFRLLLHRHTIASNWKIFYNTPARQQTPYVNRKLLAFHFGLSEDPHLVGDPPCTANKNSIDPRITFDSSTVKAILKAVCGDRDAKRRYGLKNYWIQHKPNHEDSSNIPYIKLFRESGKFGLNTLSIVKVQDALRLCPFVWDSLKQKVMPPDKAFAEVLTVMTDKYSMLPWEESPERAWLRRTYGEKYFTALLDLNILISRSKLADIPLSIKCLNHVLGGKVDFDSGYRRGYELLWCDFGFNPRSSLMMLRNSKDPQDIRVFTQKVSKTMDKDKRLLQNWHRFLLYGSEDLTSDFEKFEAFGFRNFLSEARAILRRSGFGCVLAGVKGVWKILIS